MMGLHFSFLIADTKSASFYVFCRMADEIKNERFLHHPPLKNSSARLMALLFLNTKMLFFVICAPVIFASLFSYKLPQSTFFLTHFMSLGMAQKMLFIKVEVGP